MGFSLGPVSKVGSSRATEAENTIDVGHDPRRRFVRSETRVRAHAGGQTITEYAYKTRSCCGRVVPNKPVAGSYWHASLCSCPVSTPISNRAYRTYTVQTSNLRRPFRNRDERPVARSMFPRIFRQRFYNFYNVIFTLKRRRYSTFAVSRYFLSLSRGPRIAYSFVYAR